MTFLCSCRPFLIVLFAREREGIMVYVCVCTRDAPSILVRVRGRPLLRLVLRIVAYLERRILLFSLHTEMRFA